MQFNLFVILQSNFKLLQQGKHITKNIINGKKVIAYKKLI